MGYWLRTLCRRPLGEKFGVKALTAAIARLDFAAMAEMQELEHDVGYAAEDVLRVENVEPGVLLVYFRPDDDHFVRADLWQGDEAKEELDDLTRALEGDRSPGAAQVRAHLTSTTESVAFELKQSDVEGMGWPIAFYASMWLAEEGDGLVEWEGAWFDPRISYFEPVFGDVRWA